MADNSDQIAYWNEIAGDKWVANQERLDRLMAPLTQALMEAAAPRRGELVLDIGCGCGDTALRLAEAVGSEGLVRAIDVSRPMLIHAEERRRALTDGDRADIQWIAGDAMVHRFPPVNDLLISRFGVMFFADKARAFANLRSALADAGRFVFIAWQRQSAVAWMHLPLTWIASIVPEPDEMEGEIGPFALANPDDTCRLLTAAGFQGIVAEPVTCQIVMGEGSTNEAAIDDALTLLTNTGPAAALLREAESDAQAKGAQLIRDALAKRAHDGRISLEGACWIYRGTA